MATYKAFHSQLTAIMAALTKAAVAEICGLVEQGYAVLQMEISRSHQENQDLRRKMELIETVLARGQRPGQDGSDGWMMDLTVERALPAGGAQPLKAHLNRGGRVPGSEAMMDLRQEAAGDPEDQDVVLIKDEAAKEELNSRDVSEQLLLNEDGAEEPLEYSDCEEGPSGLMMISASGDTRPWDQQSSGPSDVGEQLDSHSALGSPGPAGGADNSSTDAVFDLASESDCDAPSDVHSGKTFLQGSGGSPSSLPGTSELKRSLIGSLPFDSELDLCPSWTNQGLSGLGAVPQRSSLLDKVSDLSAAGFPLGLGLGGSRLDPVDLNRYCRDRRFVCSYCGKCFTSSRSLETHVRVHTGERPYSCAQCGKRFTQSGHLKTHQSVHTGERPYGCQYCGKRFAGKQNLRIHQQKHHTDEQCNTFVAHQGVSQQEVNQQEVTKQEMEPQEVHPSGSNSTGKHTNEDKAHRASLQ